MVDKNESDSDESQNVDEDPSAEEDDSAGDQDRDVESDDEADEEEKVVTKNGSNKRPIQSSGIEVYYRALNKKHL